MRWRYYQLKNSLIIFCLFSTKGFGQSDSLRYKLIESLSKDIYKYYVSGSLAKKMGDSIKLKYETGGFDSTLNIDEFTFEITRDLRRISNDNHLTVTPPHSKSVDLPDASFEYDITTPKELKKQIEKNKKEEKRYRKSLKEDMFSYGEIKILPKNVGYVEIKKFNPASAIKSENKNRISIESLFQFFKKTNSLIIDLRENVGGLTNLAAKLCSYFSPQSNAYFITEENFLRYDSGGIEREFSVRKNFYTDAHITNNLTRGKNIYILISGRTFSAAELAVYKIKQFMPTVTVIGEQTRGGGNGYSGTQNCKYYTAIIPSSKSFDESNVNNNIEGKGITPDVFSVSDSALQIAYRLTGDENVDTSIQKVKYFKKTRITETRPGFEGYYPDYVGDYRKISVYINNGSLYMLYDTSKKYSLIPTEKDFFQTEGFEFIRFVRNSNMQVAEIQIKHTDRYLEKFKK